MMCEAAARTAVSTARDTEAGNPIVMNPRSEAGYTLIGLMLMVAVSSILMAAYGPTWHYLVTRDKEEELIFRGESYKTAIERYQKRFNKLPSEPKELTKYNFIRKLYLDPMTDFEFELILQGPEGKKRESELTAAQRKTVRGEAPGTSSYGIVGVVSMSDKVAIRPWNEKERYNEWEFIAGEGSEEEGQPGADEPEGGEEG
jgi:type II secretory pathway pseudopilin PulG